MSSRRWYGIAALLIVLTLPARVAQLGSSLWLDEAWVANSIGAPTLHDMFFYPTWAQTTPPMFLLMERAVAWIAGNSEVALRTIPLLAGVAALVLTVRAFSVLFAPLPAVAGFLFVACNYWAVKYPQQVKQYGVDLLVSSALVYLLALYWQRGYPRRIFWLLTAAGAFGACFAATGMFFTPSIVISLLAGERRVRALAASAFIVLAQSANYLVFIQPNRSVALVHWWDPLFLSIRHPLASLLLALWDYSVLLVPFNLSPAIRYVLMAGMLAVAAAASVRCWLLMRRGAREAIVVGLAALLPVACMLAAGFLRLYPMLFYTRMILWSLPCVALFAAFAAEPVARFVERRPRRGEMAFAFAVLCVCAALAVDVVMIGFPRPGERNEAAVDLLRTKMGPGDWLYLHGGMWEQFRYYSGRASWSPGHVYVGRLNWSCCALNIPGRVTTPGAPDFHTDVTTAAVAAKGQRLWFLMPAGTPGHWSAPFRNRIDSIPAEMAAQGCTAETRASFDQTLVLGFRCASPRLIHE